MSSLSHDEFIKVICMVCARKRDGKRSDKQKLGNLKPISDRILELIHTTHYPKHVIGSCPTVVCSSCVLALEDAEKNGTEAKRKIFLFNNFSMSTSLNRKIFFLNIFSMSTSLNSILEEVSRSPDPQPLH